MNVRELIDVLSAINDKTIEVRMPCCGLLVPVETASLTYIIKGYTEDDHPSEGWVKVDPEKLPEAVAFVLEPGDD